jgi:hypothetical protein
MTSFFYNIKELTEVLNQLLFFTKEKEDASPT